MKWRFEDNTPIYLQLVKELKILIANGTYPMGSQLPTVRELALEANVNPNTVQRAMGELEKEGLIHAQRTSGRFVCEDEEKIKQLRRILGRGAVTEMFEKLSKLGMTKEEIINEVKVFAGRDEV